jgi:hypothetical protein
MERLFVTSLDFESDRFLELLTDALRAGPGSPAWHDALGKLKERGMAGDIESLESHSPNGKSPGDEHSTNGAPSGNGVAISPSGNSPGDEYRLLLQAREHLESGKEYRSIQAGPEFTRKVMEAVDREDQAGKKAKGVPTPTIIATIAGLAVLVLAIVVGHLLMNGSAAQRPTLADLQSQTFSRDALTASFTGNLPAGWNQIGPLKLIFDPELRPTMESVGKTYSGGAIVSAVPMPPDQAFAVDVTLRLGDPGENVIEQVFVTDQPVFSDDRATSAHELVWTLQPMLDSDKKPFLRPEVVLPDGTFAGTGADIHKPRQALNVHIAVNTDFVLVDSDGSRIYAGPHQLAFDKPRYMGVRFLRRNDLKSKDEPGIVSLRISK